MKHIIETLEQVEQMVGRMAEQGALEIERDLLLEKIRKIYADVLKLEVAEVVAGEQEVVVPVVPFVEPAVEDEPIVEEEIPYEEPAVEETYEEEIPYEEPATEEVYEEEIIVEEEEIYEEPAQEEPIVDAQESVLALYDDEDENEDDEPVIEEEPVAIEEEEVVEESVEEPAAETLFDEPEVTPGVVSLRRTIGVNDKFLLMRDLFGGNNEYYDRVITKLDSFDSLDEAMIYIHDNYHWNPQSEGARLLVELLARKLY